MVTLPLVLDQPKLEPTSTITVIVGMNALETSVQNVKLVLSGQGVLLNVKKVLEMVKKLVKDM